MQNIIVPGLGLQETDLLHDLEAHMRARKAVQGVDSVLILRTGTGGEYRSVSGEWVSPEDGRSDAELLGTLETPPKPKKGYFPGVLDPKWIEWAKPYAQGTGWAWRPWTEKRNLAYGGTFEKGT